MLTALEKYRQAFLVGLQSNLVYRWNFLSRSLFAVINLAVAFILWGAAFASSPNIGGFDFSQTITYFVILIALQFFVGAFNEDYQIGEDIRNGLINQFILKPINYYLYRFSIFVAARLVSGGLILLPLLAVLPFLHHWLTLSFSVWQMALALPAMALAAIVQFTMAYCFGLMAFWFLEIQGFVILSLAVETVLGGQVFPLDLLPPRIFAAAQWLPFCYQMYFPAAVLTGRIPVALAVRDLGIQALWAAALLGLAQFLWNRGLRRHTAVGG